MGSRGGRLFRSRKKKVFLSPRISWSNREKYTLGGIPFHTSQLVPVFGLLQITKCPFQDLDGFPELFPVYR